jgi:predicted nucleic acid-binding protein
MAVKIVDASALVALLFGEPEADAIAARLQRASLAAAALLGLEIASACLKKLRRNPEQHDELLAALAMFGRRSIEIVEVDHADTVRLAETFGLTSYDAAYLWVAQLLSGELVALDTRLQSAATARR